MTQRRDFIRHASLLAAGSLAASPLAAAAPDADALPVQGNWDMSWAARVTGRHKMCFDAHEISEGVCLHQARSFLQGYKDVYGLQDSDVSAVLVIRHAAVPMVMNDSLWADGFFGEENKLKDPESGEVAKRNPFVNVPAGAQHSLVWPDGGLDTLISRGVIVLACNLALTNYASGIARRRSIPRQDGLALVNANLIPGVIKMPTGVFATCHAQQLGCGVLNAV
jgi:hypothetical protein